MRHKLKNFNIEEEIAFCEGCRKIVPVKVQKDKNGKVYRRRCRIKVRQLDENFRVKNPQYKDKYINYKDEKLDRLFADIPKPDKCVICESTIRLVRDHDHTTGKARNWICYACNLGLGCFKDNIDTLFKAVTYLKFHS